MTNSDLLWRPDGNQSRPPLVSASLAGEVYRPDILAVIERTIDELGPALRTLSDKIHGASPLVLPMLQLDESRSSALRYLDMTLDSAT